MNHYDLLVCAIRTQACIAQCECICTAQRPVCLLDEDGSRSRRQPFVYAICGEDSSPVTEGATS